MTKTTSCVLEGLRESATGLAIKLKAAIEKVPNTGYQGGVHGVMLGLLPPAAAAKAAEAAERVTDAVDAVTRSLPM